MASSLIKNFKEYVVKSPLEQNEKLKNSMLLSAKMGEWDKVWEILDKNPHFVNCIPEKRSWGILHQACHWKNEEAIKKILSTPGCDPNLVTKDGLQAIEITKIPCLKEIITNAASQVTDVDNIKFALERRDMSQVTNIIETHHHLVNIVSPLTGLTPLHQSVLLGEVGNVIRILSYPASNPDVKTIEAPLNTYGADKTAEQLTDSEEVKEVIGWKKQQLKQEYYECPTFVDINDSNILLVKYVCTSIEAHRGLLCSERFNSQQFEAFPVLIENIYLYIYYSYKWEDVKMIVRENLDKYSHDLAEECCANDSKDYFYKFFISTYINHITGIFKGINSEIFSLFLENQKDTTFSVFFTILNAILFFWEDLDSYTGVTYSRMNATTDQIRRFKVGTEFAWPCFIACTTEISSSSIKETFLSPNCIFEFDNSLKCEWSPKHVVHLNEFKIDVQCLYPCGAQFRVNKVEKSNTKTYIYLQLISKTEDTYPLRSLFGEPRFISNYSFGNKLSTMVLAAKMGHWDIAMEILMAHNYLVNCIPEERSWGILHQACFCENEEAVKHILSVPGRDPQLKTKDGLCPIDIAKTHRLKELIQDAIKAITQIDEYNFVLESGNMTEILNIIDTNKNFVNEISPTVGLGPLHHAAVQGDVYSVIQVLDYPASNPDVKTIEAPLNTYGVDKTAEQLTDSEEVKEVIGWKKQQLKQEYYECPTFVDISYSNIILMRYVYTTIENHRILLPENFNPELFNVLPDLMEKLFLHIHYSTDKWTDAMHITYPELHKHSRSLAQKLKATSFKFSFYKYMIEIYTNEKTQIYKKVNDELRNQAVHQNYEFSSYSTLMNSILFFWNKLQGYTEVTYRGMRVRSDHIDQYSVGTEFAWLNFVSSSNDKRVATERFIQSKISHYVENLLKHLNVNWLNPRLSSGTFINCIFIIDNSLKCKWSPKSIADFSEFKDEKEYLYPCGAQFRVTKVDKTGYPTYIYLTLICPVDPTAPRSLFNEVKLRAEFNILKVASELDEFNIVLDQLRQIIDEILGYKMMLNIVLRKNNQSYCQVGSISNPKVLNQEFQQIPSILLRHCNNPCHDPSYDHSSKLCSFATSDYYCIACQCQCHSDQDTNVMHSESIEGEEEFNQLLESTAMLLTRMRCLKSEILMNKMGLRLRLKELDYIVALDQDRWAPYHERNKCLMDVIGNFQFRISRIWYPEPNDMKEKMTNLVTKMKRNCEIRRIFDTDISGEGKSGTADNQHVFHMLEKIGLAIRNKIDISFTVYSETLDLLEESKIF